jgi:enoyl-CoA hydratase/carnithine racemase
MSQILQVSRQDRVLHLTLNRPEKRNALNAALCHDLSGTLAQAQEDPDVGAILLTGNGKVFSAGMDLQEVLTPEAEALAGLHEHLFTAFAWLEKPLIAAVHGAALAGGTGLVANAHIVVAAEEATFGLTEIRLGLWPFLIFRAVAAAVGERRAVELSLTGRIFGASEAMIYGLVHHVVPAAELHDRALAIARGVADAGIFAIRSGLAFLHEIRGMTLEDSGRAAADFRRQTFESEEFRQRVRAFLDTKKKA